MAFGLDDEDLRVFLDEAQENLEQLEEHLLGLEQEGPDAARIQEMFRAAHTLKGASATLGHAVMADLCHHLENGLDRLRKGALQPDSDVIDVFFRALDALKRIKSEIARGVERTAVDVAPVLAELEVISRQAGSESTAAGNGGFALPEATSTSLPRSEPVEASGAPRGEASRILMVETAPDSAMPSVRLFQVLITLEEMGTVLSSEPSRAELEDDIQATSLVAEFESRLPSREIERRLAAVPEVIVRTVAGSEPLAAVQPAGAAAAKEDVSPRLPKSGAPSQATRGAPTSPAGPVPTEPTTRSGAGKAISAAPPAPSEAAPVSTGQDREASRNRTVRVDVGVLDNLMNLVGELVIDRTRLTQILGRLHGSEAAEDLGRTSAHIGRVTTELQEQIMRARMLPVETLFKKFPRMMRDLGQRSGKLFDFALEGGETELDRSVIEEVSDPIMHMLRNAVDHGLEPPDERRALGKPERGRIVLSASHEEDHVVLRVQDDGRGIDPARMRQAAVRKGLMTAAQAARLSDEQAIHLVFAPGFSTAEAVTDVSGRGVGMDVVHRNIERLSGAVQIRTEIGRGTEFRVKLPLTLAIIRALLVRVAGLVLAMPLVNVTETLKLAPDEVRSARRHWVIVVRERALPLFRLADLLELEGPADSGGGFVVIVQLQGRQFGLQVDGLVGEQEVVIKSLGRLIGQVPGVAGATILGDGNVAVILDAAGLVELAEGQRSA